MKLQAPEIPSIGTIVFAPASSNAPPGSARTLEDLRQSASGRVVTVASIAATTCYPYPGHAASKAALLSLKRTLLLYFWGRGDGQRGVPGCLGHPMVKREAIPPMVAKTLGRPHRDPGRCRRCHRVPRQ